MNQLTAQPNRYDFGSDFNYALWVPGTVATLVNVPWNNDYRDVVKFEDRDALNAYIDSRENSGRRITELSYVKPNNPIRLDIPFNVALRHNYIRVSSPVQPIPNDVRRDYYYFITDVRYVAPNTTEIIAQLDVFQTFIYDFKFGNCYIERGHAGIANSRAFDNYGRDYLTISEGLNTGSEYQVIAKRSQAIIDHDFGGDRQGDAVLVVTTADIFADPGTKADPDIKVPRASDMHRLPIGAGMYVFKTIADYNNMTTSLRNAPWLANSIISQTVIPNMGRYFSGIVWDTYDAPWRESNGEVVNTVPVTYKHLTAGFNGTAGIGAGGYLPPNKTTKMWANWRNAAEILNKIPAKYRHLKKFLTFPYMAIEVTTWSGAPIILKPESWANADADFLERVNLIPPNQRVSFIPRSYNAVNGTPIDENGDDSGEFLDLVANITAFPSLPTVNDSGALILAQNAATRAFSFDSANWSQQRALAGNDVSYDQASGALNTAKTLTGIGINQDSNLTNLGNNTMAMQTGISAIAGLAGGMGGGAAGIAGAALGVTANIASTAVQTNANSQALTIRNTGAASVNNAQNHQGALVRDTNKDLGDWAARGDYANSIAAINAKVEDTRLTQPSLIGQFGGEVMNVIYRNSELSLRFKMIDQASIKAIGDYWLRYGYAVNIFANIPESLQVMSKFTYWKLKETYALNAPMPEPMKQAIRGIFEKGVTVWSKPEYIGSIDIGDNVPLEGFTL